jgi:hypothetical protein
VQQPPTRKKANGDIKGGARSLKMLEKEEEEEDSAENTD